MSTPRITALINTYNYGRYVGEAIESVLAQDFPAQELEILVVDDGSTDNTRDVVARYGERVRYCYKPNGGQASAFNLGFQQARGEIVALLDADDVWLPAKVRRVMDIFDASPELGMVYHALRYRDEQADREWDDPDFPAMSGDVPRLPQGLLRYGVVSTSAMALRKSALERLLPVPEELTILADSYLAYLMIFVAPVAGIREWLTRMRLHGENNFNYAAADRARKARRLHVWSRAVREIEGWLKRSGFDLSRPELADYLERYHLVESEFRFQLQPPRRAEFVRYLREHSRLYGPLWTPHYRMFRRAVAWMGWVLGYRGFAALRELYRERGSLPQWRERLVSARAPDPFTPAHGKNEIATP